MGLVQNSSWQTCAKGQVPRIAASGAASPTTGARGVASGSGFWPQSGEGSAWATCCEVFFWDQQLKHSNL